LSIQLRVLVPLLFALSACRSAPPPEPRLPAPETPTLPAPTSHDPVVEETRRAEEALETPAIPAGLDAPERAHSTPAGTIEIAFATGAAELTAPAAARLDALAAELKVAPAPYPLELVASVEDGSGSDGERALLRRRLAAVRSRLQKGGVAGDRIAVVESPAPLDVDSAGAAPIRPCHVFVIVRQP
jgi:outer membrane protein OmpA-like peptidoglycan-associated protein